MSPSCRLVLGFQFDIPKALELSNTKWIVIIDHDDICDEDRLTNQLKDIKYNSNCKLFFGDAIYFDNNNQFSKFKNLQLKDTITEKLDLEKDPNNMGKEIKALLGHMNREKETKSE